MSIEYLNKFSTLNTHDCVKILPTPVFLVSLIVINAILVYSLQSYNIILSGQTLM